MQFFLVYFVLFCQSPVKYTTAAHDEFGSSSMLPLESPHDSISRVPSTPREEMKDPGEIDVSDTVSTLASQISATAGKYFFNKVINFS